MDVSQAKGLIADIQRCSLHDGPGIRTSVFFKGCNMRCQWCHNPEMLNPHPEILLTPSLCIHCGQCQTGCYSGARRTIGREMTVDEVMKEVLHDEPYYGDDGGITLTGGEPTLQPDFAFALLTTAKRAGISRAIETNLFADPETLRKLCRLCDYVMCDLKIWDDAQHISYTGVSNTLIKENIAYLDGLGMALTVRTPVIQGVNDNDDSIENIASFLGSLKNLCTYELLPYHKLGLSKRIQPEDAQTTFDTPDTKVMNSLAYLASQYVRDVKIAGRDIKREAKE